MYQFKTYQKKLIKMALITSPLIGLISVIPMFIFVLSIPNVEQFVPSPRIDKMIRALSFISFIIFLVWMGNIFLLKFVSNNEKIKRKNRNVTRYALSYLLSFLIICITTSIREHSNRIDFEMLRFYPFLSIFISTTFILILINLIVTQNEKAQLEIDHLISQQEQLKQQIHPHFLFNALGTLQILIDRDSVLAKSYNSKLAKYLRSSLSFAKYDLTTVEEEIDFMQNYLDLQQMRFAGAIKYEVDVPKNIRLEKRLPVFSLQLLAENAIKHNAFNSQIPLCFSVKYTNNEKLIITNNKLEKFNKEDSTKIGLTNLVDRYQHFTTELPSFEETETSFSVQLKLL